MTTDVLVRTLSVVADGLVDAMFVACERNGHDPNDPILQQAVLAVVLGGAQPYLPAETAWQLAYELTADAYLRRLDDA